MSDAGPVRKPSPSSSSSATLLLLLMFARLTFVLACGKRAVLIICTPISSGSLASLFEGEGVDISSKSISATNLKFSQINRSIKQFFPICFYWLSISRNKISSSIIFANEKIVLKEKNGGKSFFRERKNLRIVRRWDRFNIQRLLRELFKLWLCHFNCF